MKLTVTTFMQKGDGTRSRQISGFDGAEVLISGERSESIAAAIVERFTQSAAPRKPMGPGGCVRLDGHGVWLLNRADRGWSSSGTVYDSWRDLLNEWDLAVGAPLTDKTGVYWPVGPRSAITPPPREIGGGR